MKRQKGFTLAEALIVLVLLGVIAAITIPAVLINSEQAEYKTAFKKALSTMNEAIQLTIATEGYGPLETGDYNASDSLFNLFRNKLSVISTSTDYKWGNKSNYAFFTADGMRFEFPTSETTIKGTAFVTHQCAPGTETILDESGAEHNSPCLVVVDVNGERKPNPRSSSGSYRVPSITGSKARFLDVFPVIVTDKNAYPFGVIAQRALFQAD